MSSPHISEELSGPSLLSELMSSKITSQSFLRAWWWREVVASGACSIGSFSSAGDTLDSEEGGVAGVTLPLNVLFKINNAVQPAKLALLT